MKNTLLCCTLLYILISCTARIGDAEGQNNDIAVAAAMSKHLMIDVHDLVPGKVTFSEASDAHMKDLAIQNNYGVRVINFWVDETAGKVYCLAEAHDSVSLCKMHHDAHGFVPDRVYDVTEGVEATMSDNPNLFLDIHKLDVGNLTEDDVAADHIKDLDVQSKYGVTFINYWVDTNAGVMICLAQSKDSTSIANSHEEAHGWIPDEIHHVKQGQ